MIDLIVSAGDYKRADITCIYIINISCIWATWSVNLTITKLSSMQLYSVVSHNLKPEYKSINPNKLNRSQFLYIGNIYMIYGTILTLNTLVVIINCSWRFYRPRLATTWINTSKHWLLFDTTHSLLKSLGLKITKFHNALRQVETRQGGTVR